ncbi:YopX protein [Streptococcus gordonii]|uniref:YopX family protein n=1 Tax=Streptococcus gordonii TaxID=1302 RepID=UPI0007799799|nr:YopX family protein [Streptococcus gordonii]VTT11416.1 YopX protein [Streptococcus gordonii]
MIPKFRVWDKTDKEMYLVDVINFNRGEFESIGDGITFLREADEVILMQSTGLKDKNGQEIFEGDIIDTTDYEGGLSSVGHPFVKVECDKYGFVVTGDFPGSPITLKEFEHGRKFAGVEVTIAGNIYENPDLLEVIK